jgi:hypothetical protein
MASMAPPEQHPLPPVDFVHRDLPIEEIPIGATFIRIHRSDLDALHFGANAINRFDDPKREYGVCYVANTREGAFAETCLRAVGAQFVALSFLAARSFATIEVIGTLQLVAVHGQSLAPLGATSVVTGGDHALSQIWSRALHDHPAAPDGVLYRANHDNDEICAAIFERARTRLRLRPTESIMSDRASLGALLDRYKVGLG